MKVGSNGSALSVLGISDNGDAHYVLIRPDGSTALNDTLESLDQGRVLTMSPCGEYYYRFRQEANEVILHLVAGGVRHLRLPMYPTGIGPLYELPTATRFIAEKHLLAVTVFPGAAPRRVLWDISVEPPHWIQLQNLDEMPTEQYPRGHFVGDVTVEGDLILFEQWEGEYPLKYEVCCYDRSGSLRWHQYPNLRPSWIVAATDRPLVAVASPTSLTILDPRTGTLQNGRRLWEKEANAYPWTIREIAFEDNRFTVAALGGGDGITPVLISVDVGDDGTIGNPRVTNDWIWGFKKDRPVCGAAWQDSTGGWMIAGFRR